MLWASTTRLHSVLSCCCSAPTSACSLAAASSCVNMSNSHAAQAVLPCNICCIQVEKCSVCSHCCNVMNQDAAQTECRLQDHHNNTCAHWKQPCSVGRDSCQPCIHMCEPSVYLCRARGILSPRHLVLQAGNLLLQAANYLLLLCCLCSQLDLQCELTASNHSIRQAKLQRPLAVSKHPCKTRSVMLLQYIHGKIHKGTL